MSAASAAARRKSKRERSNQQELLKEMEPHGRPYGRVVGALRVMQRYELQRRRCRGTIAAKSIGKCEPSDYRSASFALAGNGTCLGNDGFARPVRMAVVLVARLAAIRVRR